MEFDHAKVDALMSMARDCLHWNNPRALGFVDEALTIARNAARGEVPLGEALAAAAEVFLGAGLHDKATSCLMRASEGMRAETSDELEIEAIVRVGLKAAPKLAEAVSGALIKTLAERGSWSTTSCPLLEWSDHVIQLLLHAAGRNSTSLAHALLHELARADELEARVFIG